MLDDNDKYAVEKLITIYRNHTIDGLTSVEGMSMLMNQFMEFSPNQRAAIAIEFENEVKALEA